MDLQRLLTPCDGIQDREIERGQSAPLAATPRAPTSQWKAINTVRGGAPSKPLPVDMAVDLPFRMLDNSVNNHQPPRSAFSTPTDAPSQQGGQLHPASHLYQATSIPAPTFPLPQEYVPSLHHPVPQTPLRLEASAHRWTAQWTEQAQLLGLVPSSRPDTPAATPAPEMEVENLGDTLLERQQRFEERVGAFEGKLTQQERGWEGRVAGLERVYGERIIALDKRVDQAMECIDGLQEWKVKVERQVQMQVDVVAELVKRVIRMEKKGRSGVQTPEEVQKTDDTGEQRLQPDLCEDIPSYPGIAGFQSPLSMSSRATPEFNDFSDGLPSSACMSRQETPTIPSYLTSSAATKRSTGKKVTKHRRKVSTVDLPPVAALRITKTSAASSSKPTPKFKVKPSRPLSRVPQPVKPLPEPSRPRPQYPVPAPAGQPTDPPSTVKTSSLRTTLPDGTQVPIFIFRKHPDTVQEQWDEYERGLGGQRAVRWLDEVYTTKWRRDSYARTWYSRRKRFWDLCKGFMKMGLGEEAALASVEELMGGATVAGFVDWLGIEMRNGGGIEAVMNGKGPQTAGAGKGAAEAGGKGIKRKAAVRPAVRMVEEEEVLAVESESEDEERAHKRRSSLRLRGRDILPPIEDVESSDDSDSVIEW